MKDNLKYICRAMPPSGLVITYMFGYENDNPSAEYLKYRVFGEKYGGSIKVRSRLKEN